MIYIVRYANQTSFMKEWAKDPQIKVQLDDERTQATNMTYKKSSVPGTVVNFAPKFADGKMQVKMSQDELNQAVQDMKIYINDKQLMEAPLGTQDHPFWKSEHAYLLIERGEAKLNDAHPKDRIMINAMRLDSAFWFKAETNKPPVKGVVKWEVVPLDGKSSQIVDDEAGSIQATTRLLAMGFEKQKSIAKIFGKPLAEDTDPSIVQAMLFRIITAEKDLLFSEGITNLQKFMSLSEADNAEINLHSLVHDSKKFLTKKAGYFHYGEIKLGRTVDEIAAYLKNDNDLITELSRQIKK